MTPDLPIWHGFNLLEKFTHSPDEWASLAPEWGYANEPFRESDFAAIRELGFNYVRLPMSYRCWCNEKDWYSLNDKSLHEIDQAVEFGRQYGLHVCINFHRAPGYTINDVVFKPQYRERMSVWDDEQALEACAFHWQHFTSRYKGIPSSALSFSLFNEPTRTSAEKHDRVIRRLTGEIKATDPDRLIVIDGLDFQPVTTLADLHLVQCTRGYQPGEVTHYKASWAGAPDVLPTWPMQDTGGILWNREKLREDYKAWRDLESQGTPVYVGEFGVYNQTPHGVTLSLLNDYLDIWKEFGWGWAMWCFRGPFGIAESGRKDVVWESFQGLRLDRRMYELLKRYL